MELFDAPPAMRAWTAAHHRHGRSVACVPTMGALHAGHLALVDEARRRADVVVVTIFVNPLQFNRHDDFDKYPRPIDGDLEACRAAGADAVYAPTAATMYPHGFQTHVEPGELAATLEGTSRPGHFRGVTTVVAKLFGAIRPDVALFGQKDFQQLAIIKRMVADLDIGVQIVPHPTVREADGLAMSSRNARLTAADRAAAGCIPQALLAAQHRAAAGEDDPAQLELAAVAIITAEPRASLEYVAVIDPDTLHAMERLDRPALIATAVWFGDVRLIDNMQLAPAHRPL